MKVLDRAGKPRLWGVKVKRWKGKKTKIKQINSQKGGSKPCKEDLQRGKKLSALGKQR